MPLASSPFVALPRGAREDLAWQDVLSPTEPAVGTSFAYTVPGDFYDVLVSASWQLVTDATVVNRTAEITFEDNNAKVIALVAAPAVQPASTTVQYGAVQGIGAGYGPAGGPMVLQTPPIVLQPGYKIRVTWANSQNGDRLKAITLVLTHIPTGPQRVVSVPLVATPLLT